MKTVRPLVLVATVLIPLAASAADVQVSYLVDLKKLKASAPAGTPLTFSLFSDNACTTQVASQVVNVENVNVIESLKCLTRKGATKVPQTARLTTTLTGVTVGGNLYLTVTGAGVMPVGGACQVQGAQAAEHFPTTRVTLQAFGKNSAHITAGAGAFTPLGLTALDREPVSVLISLDPHVLHMCDIETPLSNDSNVCRNLGETPPCAVAFSEGGAIAFNVANCTDLPPSCTDNILNQDETATDCGGTHCPPCPDHSACKVPSDCMSGHCIGGICQ